MDEAKLRSIAQLQESLNAIQEISFTSAPGGRDYQRHEHISRVPKRFEYPGAQQSRAGGVVLVCAMTSQPQQPGAL